MDPRLSPKLTPQPQNLLHDVARPAAPAPAPSPPVQSAAPSQTLPAAPAVAAPVPELDQPNPISQPMVPQIVEAFPVKQQAGISAQAPASAAPAVSQSDPKGSSPAQPEDDLDKILQAVNNRVKVPNGPLQTKKKRFGKKILSKTVKVKDKARRPKPIGPVFATLIVALMLGTTAIFAYREGNHTATAAKDAGKVGTSYTASSAIQEAGGTLVNPADLDDYAQTLQTKLNGLNDSQDFTADPLSDKILGL